MLPLDRLPVINLRFVCSVGMCRSPDIVCLNGCTVDSITMPAPAMCPCHHKHKGKYRSDLPFMSCHGAISDSARNTSVSLQKGSKSTQPSECSTNERRNTVVTLWYRTNHFNLNSSMLRCEQKKKTLYLRNQSSILNVLLLIIDSHWRVLITTLSCFIFRYRTSKRASLSASIRHS